MSDGTTYYDCAACGQPRTLRGNCFTCDYAAAKVEIERGRGGMYETIKKAHEDGYAEGIKDERARVLALVEDYHWLLVDYGTDTEKLFFQMLEEIKTPKTEGTK